MNGNYNCPVCGFDKLVHPPERFYICPCCGTEFGYDDATLSHPDLRREWINNGLEWFSDAINPPVGWNPIVQLIRAGYGRDLPALYSPSAQETRGFVDERTLVRDAFSRPGSPIASVAAA